MNEYAYGIIIQHLSAQEKKTLSLWEAFYFEQNYREPPNSLS